MDIKKLQAVVIDALENIKGQDIRVFDTMHLTSLFDRMAIASGTSNRQTKALAASVRDSVKENGGTIVSIEGEETGEWVLVDLGDMIVHIMQPAIRDYYRLEEIWGEKEIKLGAMKRSAKQKTSDAANVESAPKKTSRHLASSKAAGEDEPKKPARKTATRTTASKTAPPKTTKAPVGKTVRVTPVKRATSAPRKTPAKRASTRKTVE